METKPLVREDGVPPEPILAVCGSVASHYELGDIERKGDRSRAETPGLALNRRDLNFDTT
jgi:hypothetical protein